MKRPLAALALLAASAAPCVGDDADARDRLNALISSISGAPLQAEALVGLAFGNATDDEDLAALALQRLDWYTGVQVVAPLYRTFRQAGVEERRRILAYTEELYLRIKGKHSSYLNMLRDALHDEDAPLRNAALAQISGYRVERLALEVADVYYIHPEDRVAALDTLGALGDRRGIAPAIDALASGDQALRDSAVRTLARIGRPGAVHLKELMLGENEELAKRAGRALLGFAEPKDLSVLYEFAERYAAIDDELGQRLTRAIALLEVNQYNPPEPEDL